MLMISSLTLLISLLPLLVAAHLDPRSQEENSFVTVPLVHGRNLTFRNGAFDIEAARHSILVARSIKRQNPINLERRSGPSPESILSTFIPKKFAKITTEVLATYLPTRLREKFGIFDRLLPTKGRVRLTSQRSAPYVGKVTIGSPPCTFLVGFATDLNVSEIGIPPKPKKGDYTNKNVYITPTNSPTYVKDEIRTYPDSGVGFVDTMTLGNIKVNHQYFVGIPSFAPRHRQEGTIALGFEGLGAPSTFMDLALRGRQIEKKVFGVSFAPGKPEYHFGGTNTELYTKPIQFHQVLRPSLDRHAEPVLTDWLLGNARVYVGDSGSPVLSGLETIISTDSLLTWGPRAEVEAIYGQIEGSQKFNDKGLKKEGFDVFYEFPCSTKPKVKLSWDNEEPWPYLGFVRPVDPKKPGPVMCFGTIAAYDPESEMAQRLEGRFLIGTRFLEGLYTGFFIKDRTAEIMFGKLK